MDLNYITLCYFRACKFMFHNRNTNISQISESQSQIHNRNQSTTIPIGTEERGREDYLRRRGRSDGGARRAGKL